MRRLPVRHGGRGGAFFRWGSHGVRRGGAGHRDHAGHRDYFTGYGFDTDLASAAVDKVKIPKKWDDSFTAFNQVVGESGLTLADYKGKTVEKWTVLCPARSDGATDTYCVLLVYKAKPVGAYLLEKPPAR